MKPGNEAGRHGRGAQSFRGSLALYRLLLHLYPDDFRRRFGCEMAEELRTSLQEAYEAQGRWGMCQEWYHLLLDLLASVRHAGRPHPAHPHPRTSPRLPAEAVMDTLLLDLRHAVRALRRRPGFTVAAVTYLALGIGANTAMFSVVNAALFRPLPYPEAERIAKVRLHFARDDGREREYEEWSFPYFTAFDAATRDTFDGTAAFHPTFVNLSGLDEPRRVRVELVSDRYFDILGASPELGRLLGAEDDDVAGEGSVAILSHAAWVSWFGSDPGVLGSRLRIAELSLEIVGVASEGFAGVSGGVEIWVPFSLVPRLVQPTYLESAGYFWHHVLARVRRDVGPESLAARMEALRPVLDETYAEDAVITPRVVSLRTATVAAEARSPLAFLQGAVFFVLAIACTNVAVLTLARSVDRSREIAIRVALGAGRKRLLRQLLAEGVFVGVSGAVVGVALALGLRLLLLPALPRVTSAWTSYGLVAETPALDGRVFLFAVALGLTSGVLFSIAPAFRTLKTSPRFALQGSTGATRRGFYGVSVRSVLSASQVAFAVVLLTGAVLMLRTLHAKRVADPGFDGTNVITARVQPDAARYPGGMQDFYLPLLERLRGFPGVQAASVATSLAYGGISYRTNLSIEGIDTSFEDFEAQRKVRMHFVERDFFGVVKLRLLAGRTFDPRDVAGTPDTVVINRTFARQYFSGLDPIGQQVGFGLGRGDRQWFEIVGVVDDAYYRSIDEAVEPEAYLAYRQTAPGSVYLYLRTTGDPQAFVPTMRIAVGEIDPAAPLYAVQTLDEVGATSRSATRSLTTLLGGFAILALVLAGGGLYSTMSYAVAARSRELGIRKSLGATRRALVADVLRRGLRLTLVGIVLGSVVSFWLMRFVENQLWGVEPYDPATAVATVAVLLVSSIVASWVPAWRAARADAVVVMRGE